MLDGRTYHNEFTYRAVKLNVFWGQLEFLLHAELALEHDKTISFVTKILKYAF